MLKSLLVWSCSLMSASAMAQEAESTPLPGDLDFLAVKNVSLLTTYVYEYGQLKNWEGQDLHAGVQSFGFTLYNCKDIPNNLQLPPNPSFVCEIKDMEGNVVARHEKDLASAFKMLNFVKTFNNQLSCGMSVIRGGKYTLSAAISPDLFSYEREITLNDAPGIQISDNIATANSALSPKVYLSSGYPYSPADYSGEKQLRWQLAPADSPSEVIIENSAPFELKSSTPTLASIDSLELNAGNLEPGEYLYTLTSDFAPANYSFIAKVNDVLDPEIYFDKSAYTVGDKEAVATVVLNYGYPYVGASSSTDEPTVTLIASLLDAETSVSRSDEAWAHDDMHCTAEIKVPIEKVTEETVKEYDGRVPMKLTIMFNGVAKYEATIDLPFESGTSGIWDISADNPGQRRVRFYNIHGVEVDRSYPGLIITSDRRKIIPAPQH